MLWQNVVTLIITRPTAELQYQENEKFLSNPLTQTKVRIGKYTCKNTDKGMRGLAEQKTKRMC